jgi:hypothetical protein
MPATNGEPASTAICNARRRLAAVNRAVAVLRTDGNQKRSSNRLQHGGSNGAVLLGLLFR